MKHIILDEQHCSQHEYPKSQKHPIQEENVHREVDICRDPRALPRFNRRRDAGTTLASMASKLTRQNRKFVEGVRTLTGCHAPRSLNGAIRLERASY